MKIHLFSILFCMGWIGYVQAQSGDGGSIKGAVYDAENEFVLPGATIELLNFLPRLLVVSDTNGLFDMRDVPVGRQRLMVFKAGYERVIVSDVVVEPGKVCEQIVSLKGGEGQTLQQDSAFNELKKKHWTTNSKDRPFNTMSGVGARPFTIEEVTRYAGTRLDPARMVTNYSGAFSFNDSRNDIVIRGNSPTGVLWQVEELPLENPNHITTIGTTGGTDPIINVYAIGKADFMTGPFAAQYGNLTAGVFDIQLRRAGTSRFQTMIQIGTQRAALLLEAPLGQMGGTRRGSILLSLRASLGSYIYKYIPSGNKIDIPADPGNQDFNLKIFLPIGKKGELDVFALGGHSYLSIPYTQSTFAQRAQYYFFEGEDYKHRSVMGLAGLKYTHFFSNRLFWRTVAGCNLNLTRADWFYNEEQNDGSVSTDHSYTINHLRLNYLLNTYINAKLHKTLLLRAGINGTYYAPKLYEYYFFTDFTYINHKKGFVFLRPYAQLQYQPNHKWVLDVGFAGQWLSLRNQWGLDPRVSVTYHINPQHRLTVGYGMQHQIPNYLNLFLMAITQPNGQLGFNPNANKHLLLLRSQQAALDYDWLMAQNWRLRLSVYYQWLDNIPSSQALPAFSPLDGGADFYDINYTYSFLENKGKGQNYGVELCIEKFFSGGYYALLSGSYFDSKHRGADGVWRNTLFNSRYMMHFLIGREFYLGKAKRSLLFADLHFSMIGGKPYTPVDVQASFEQNSGFTVYDLERTNQAFFKPSYWLHLKLGGRFYGKKNRVSHSIRLDIFQLLEIFGVQNPYSAHYSQAYSYPAPNPTPGQSIFLNQRGFIPDLTYTVRF